MPVNRHTPNSAVPTHAAPTMTVASQIGIERHRMISTPTASPTPIARNFHFSPGEGAG